MQAGCECVDTTCSPFTQRFDDAVASPLRAAVPARSELDLQSGCSERSVQISELAPDSFQIDDPREAVGT